MASSFGLGFFASSSAFLLSSSARRSASSPFLRSSAAFLSASAQALRTASGIRASPSTSNGRAATAKKLLGYRSVVASPLIASKVSMASRKILSLFTTIPFTRTVIGWSRSRTSSLR